MQASQTIEVVARRGRWLRLRGFRAHDKRRLYRLLREPLVVRQLESERLGGAGLSEEREKLAQLLRRLRGEAENDSGAESASDSWVLELDEGGVYGRDSVLRVQFLSGLMLS